ncbi:MAG: WG repeat-containing protein [Ferruginibacter sp.]
MKYFFPAITKVCLCVILVGGFCELHAQTSQFNSSGDLKSTKQYYEDKAADEAKKSKVVAPAVTSTTPKAKLYSAAPETNETDLEYYTRIYDESDEQARRNGILPIGPAMRKLYMENAIAKEWPAKWPKFYDVDSGYASVSHHDKSGIIDKKGNIVIPIIWYSAYVFSEGLACVRSPKPELKFGFLDKENTWVIPLKYQDCRWGFKNGLAAVKLKDNWGYINKADVTVIPFIYDAAEEFKNGLAIVKRKKNFGVVDLAGNVIIPIKYTSLTQNYEGIFMCESKNKWGAYNQKGILITEPVYEVQFYFSGSKAKVTQKGRTFFIDMTGKEVPE